MSPGPGKVAPTLASHIISTNAMHRKEVSDISKKSVHLERKLADQKRKISDYQQEVRILKQSNESQEKELHTCRRTIERLNKDKVEYDESKKVQDAYVKKIEAKLALGARNLGLFKKTEVLSGRLADVRKENATQKDTIAILRQENDEYKNEIGVLTNALELRAEELNMQEDGSSMLLYDIAKGRDDKAKLEATVAKKESEMAAMKIALDELNIIRDCNNEELTSLEQLKEKNASEIEKLKKEVNDWKIERGVMMDYMQEVVEERDRLLERALAAEQESQSQKEETERILGHAKAATDQAGEFQKRESDMQDNLTRLMEEQHAVLSSLEESRRVEAAALQEKNQLIQTRQHLTRALTAMTEERDEQQTEAQRAQVQVQRLSEQITTLQQQLQETRAALSQASAANQSQSQATHAALQAEKKAAEDANGRTMHLEVQLLEVESQCAALTRQLAAKDQALSEANGQVNAQLQAKTLLQKTLLEQINDVRAQWKEEQGRNAQLQRALTATEVENRALLNRLGIPLKDNRLLTSSAHITSSLPRSVYPSGAAGVNSPVRSEEDRWQSPPESRATGSSSLSFSMGDVDKSNPRRLNGVAASQERPGVAPPDSSGAGRKSPPYEENLGDEDLGEPPKTLFELAEEDAY